MSGGVIIKFKKIDPQELEWEASLGGSLGTETVRKYKRAKARLEIEINCLCSEYTVYVLHAAAALANTGDRISMHVVVVFMYVAC